MSLSLQTLGEFGLIRRLQKIIKTKSPKPGSVGIGDDASVYPLGKNSFLLLSQDLLLEGVHFLPGQGKDWRQLGWKALAVNLSDLAAMGGRPLQAVVGLGLPKNFSVAAIEDLYRGLDSCARRYHCPILGGDTNRSTGPMVIAIAVLGHCEGKPLLRSGAEAGDEVWATGALGEAALGWRAIQRKDRTKESEFFRRRHAEPQPRLEWGELLRKSGMVSAMLDLSDGLASDLKRLAQASGVGIQLWADRIELSKKFSNLAARFRIRPLDLAIAGGEDYELLFCVKKKFAKKFGTWLRKTKLRATRLGEVVRGRELRIIVGGRERNYRGFEHF